jgi:hypothetical protein
MTEEKNDDLCRMTDHFHLAPFLFVLLPNALIYFDRRSIHDLCTEYLRLCYTEKQSKTANIF